MRLTVWHRALRWFPLAGWGALVLGAAGWLLFAAAHHHLDFDSAYHANMAQNWLSGYGYASSYHGRQVLDPQVTTGVTAILPLSLSLSLVGNPPWLPLVHNTVLHLLLWAGLVALWLRQPRVGALCLPLALALGGVLLMYEPRWWVLFTADMQVTLLLFLMVAWLSSSVAPEGPIATAGLGILMMWAVTAKMSAVIGVAVIAVLWWSRVAVRRRNGESPFGFRGRRLAWLLLGMLLVWLPVTVFTSLQLQGLDSVAREAWQAARWEALLNRASTGIGPLLQADNPWQHLVENIQRSWHVAGRQLGRYGVPAPGLGVMGVLVLLTAIRGLWVTVVRRKPGGPSVALAWIALAYLAWYFLLCRALVPKYAYLPVVFSAAALLTAWAEVLNAWLLRRSGHGWRTIVSLAVLAPLAVWMAGLPAAQWEKLDRFYRHPEQGVMAGFNQASVAVAEHLQQQTFPAPLAGCGWHAAPRAVEYLLPDAGHFQDCFRLIAGALEKSPEGRWELTRPVEFTWVADKSLIMLDRRNQEKNARLGQACRESLLFENHYYAIVHCSSTQVEQAVLRLGPPRVFAELSWR